MPMSAIKAFSVFLVFTLLCCNTINAQKQYYYIKIKKENPVHCGGIYLVPDSTLIMDSTVLKFTNHLKSGFENYGIECRLWKEDSIQDTSFLHLKIKRYKTQSTVIKAYHILTILGIYPLSYVSHIFEIEQLNKIDTIFDMFWTRVKIVADKYEKGLDQIEERLTRNISAHIILYE